MHYFYDRKLERCRNSSAAFEDNSDVDPMSACRNVVITLGPVTVERVMVGQQGFGLTGRVQSQQSLCTKDR